jgi:hypothetical protein
MSSLLVYTKFITNNDIKDWTKYDIYKWLINYVGLDPKEANKILKDNSIHTLAKLTGANFFKSNRSFYFKLNTYNFPKKIKQQIFMAKNKYIEELKKPEEYFDKKFFTDPDLKSDTIDSVPLWTNDDIVDWIRHICDFKPAVKIHVDFIKNGEELLKYTVDYGYKLIVDFTNAGFSLINIDKIFTAFKDQNFSLD